MPKFVRPPSHSLSLSLSLSLPAIFDADKEYKDIKMRSRREVLCSANGNNYLSVLPSYLPRFLTRDKNRRQQKFPPNLDDGKKPSALLQPLTGD